MRLLILLALSLFLTACAPAEMPVLREQAAARWGDVMARYDARANLAPIMIAIVRRYAARENDALIEVADARRTALHFNMGPDPSEDPEGFARYVRVQERLDRSVARLIEITTYYRDSGENQNLKTVLDQWRTAQAAVVMAQTGYDGAARLYNDHLSGLKGRWWARLGGRHHRAPMPLFADLPPPPAAI